MGFKFNPISGNLDLVNDDLFSISDKFSWLINSLAAFDKVVSVVYLDSGLKTQRVASISYSSAAFSDVTMTKNVFWLDVGKKNQRIEKVEYTGSIFLPDKLRKVFNYNLVNTRYIQNGFNYELF